MRRKKAILGDSGLKLMTAPVNKIYTSGDFLDVTLPKKNQAKKCTKHRTISLISHIGKIVTRILSKNGRRIINKVRFVDYIAIIAKTQDEPQDMVNRLVDTGRKYDMEINIDKSSNESIQEE